MTSSRRQSPRIIVHADGPALKEKVAPAPQPPTQPANSRKLKRTVHAGCSDSPRAKRAKRSPPQSRPLSCPGFPPPKKLAEFSKETLYHRALLLKQNQGTALRDIDLDLSTPFSRKTATDVKKRLEDVLRWKMLRGKYRPALPALLARNSAEEIDRLVAKALEKLEGCKSAEEVLEAGALGTLAGLKGVGPATAAAFLSFEVPSLVPVFSDEAAAFFEPSLGKIKYTMPFYSKFVHAMVARVNELNQQCEGWNLRRLERALWTWTTLKQHLCHEEWEQVFGAKEA